MIRFWTTLRNLGRSGDLIIVSVLVLYAPTILFWMLVVAVVCSVRDYKAAGSKEEKVHIVPGKMSQTVTIACIIALCVPMIVLNTSIIAYLLSKFLI